VIRTTGKGTIVIGAGGTPVADEAAGAGTGAAAGGGIDDGAVDAGGVGATGGGGGGGAVGGGGVAGGGAETVTSLEVLLTLPLSFCTTSITM
jgi:hypothetical protein